MDIFDPNIMESIDTAWRCAKPLASADTPVATDSRSRSSAQGAQALGVATNTQPFGPLGGPKGPLGGPKGPLGPSWGFKGALGAHEAPGTPAAAALKGRLHW